MTAVRIATYNIFMAGRKGQAVHDVVKEMAPDVMLVNESPKWPLIWRRRCRRLAEAWLMRFVTGGRPAGSNMVVVAREVQIKRAGSEKIRQPLFQPRRGIAWAQLRIDGKLFGVICCHLSLNRRSRLKEVGRVLELAGRLRGPVVIGGDLNEAPGGPSWERLRAAGFRDPGGSDWLTYPAEDPTKRIDALLVRGSATVRHHGDPGLPADLLERASDHRPVLAALELT